MSRTTTQPILVRFDHDLRLNDHDALGAACAAGAPVIPFYVDDTDAQPALGAAQKWWRHYALEKLQQDLQALGSDLIIRQGAMNDVIDALVRETDAQAVYWSRRYTPHAIAQDTQLKEALKKEDVEARSFAGHLLLEPWHVQNGQGGPYKVFTPFWKMALDRLRLAPPPRPEPAPKHMRAPNAFPKTIRVQDLGYRPHSPDWATDTLARTWGGDGEHVGEHAAMTRLHDFIAQGLSHYSGGRDLPAKPYVSRLSPYLASGNITPRQIWWAVYDAMDRDKIKASDHHHAEHFLRELGWREFSYALLYHFPHIPEKPFQPAYADFPWLPDAKAQRIWQRGMTGFPIIDAGLRELWQTGIMHNRVRMIVASFLTKNLLQPWQDGAAWFWDTLVDADLANNSASWQWVAGSGADAAPYFRIFNPVLQSAKFDPDGEYIRRYVPELSKMSNKYIHTPYDAPADVLKQAGVVLGKDYPKPMVDLKVTRARALDAMKRMKEGD